MSRKTLFRLVFLGILALFAWTCNVSDSKPDTLTLHLADSLLKKYNKYDSIRVSVFVVNKLDSADTLYRHVAFHGPYLDSSQLVNMNIGKLPSHDFVVVLIAYRAGVPALILGFPFSDGKVGKTDTLKPDIPHVNHPPVISFAALDSGKSEFMVKEGNTLFLRVVASDVDAGDHATLLGLQNAPTSCGTVGYDTLIGIFSFSPAFSCVDSASQKTLPDLIFKARDSGGLTAQITARITVEDSVRSIDVIITSPANGTITRDTVIAVAWKMNGVVQNTQTSDTLRQEGPNGIKRSFQDSLGGVASDSITVYRDRTPPGKPLVTSPGLTNNPKPKWTWRSGGNGFGYFRFKLDTANLGSDTVGLKDTAFTPAANLSDGRHMLYLQERDSVGNWSALDSGAARIDATAPHLQFSGYSDGQLVTLTDSNSVLVSGTVSESGSGLKSLGYQITGKTSQPFTSLPNSSAWNLGRITLKNGGESDVEIVAVDSAGNADTATLRINVAVPMPTVEFLPPTPPDSTVSTLSTFTIKWKVNGNQDFLDGVTLNVNETRTITKTAKNVVGDSVSSSVTITRVSDVIRFVKADAPGKNDGTSWYDAYRGLGEALKSPYPVGFVQVWVANGTYYPDTVGAGYVLEQGIHVYGGFKGKERSLAARTLDTNTIFNGLQRYHFWYINDSSALDGFDITNSVSTVISNRDTGSSGDTITVRNPAISNCRFYGNGNQNSGYFDAVIYANAYSLGVKNSWKLTNCVFRNNSMRAAKVVSPVYFLNCTFTNNRVGSDPADPYPDVFAPTDTATLQHCTFDSTKSGPASNLVILP